MSYLSAELCGCSSSHLYPCDGVPETAAPRHTAAVSFRGHSAFAFIMKSLGNLSLASMQWRVRAHRASRLICGFHHRFPLSTVAVC